MSNNIHLLQELLRLYGRKRVSPRCMLKVDFKKAFDSVQWDFIKNLLSMLGFPVQFVHLIMSCVEQLLIPSQLMVSYLVTSKV